MNLICTPRHWLPRLIDITLTLCAWALFAWLLYVGLTGLTGLMAGQGQGLRIDMDRLLLFGLESLLLYLLLSLSIACVLSLWATYRKKHAAGFKRRKRVPIMSDEALSDSFGVDYRLLQLVHEQQVLRVHNDEQGHVLSVEMPGLRKHYVARKLSVKPELVLVNSDYATRVARLAIAQ